MPLNIPNATSLPSGKKITELSQYDQSENPSSGVPCGAPVVAFQSLAVLSPELDTTNLLSGEKATEWTQLKWPLRSSPCSTPVAAFQSPTVLSSEPDAINLPSG